MKLSAILDCLLLIIITAVPAKGGSELSSVRFVHEPWNVVPTLSDGNVSSFLLWRKQDDLEGANLVAMWYLRSQDGSWKAFTWTNQDLSLAIGDVKTILEIPDSNDNQWPVKPLIRVGGEPKKSDRGLIVGDPLLDAVNAGIVTQQFVKVMEDAGWQAGYSKLLESECPLDMALDNWSATVSGAEYAIARGMPMGQNTINALVADSCGDACVISMQTEGDFLIAQADASSVLTFNGSVVANGTVVMKSGIVKPGDRIVSGMLRNVGSKPITVLASEGFAVTVPAGRSFEPLRPATCENGCREIIDIVDGPGGSQRPVYCTNSRCVCKCWANRQNPAWLATLPNCPCTLATTPGGDPINPDKDNWRDPGEADPGYHPGAAHCMRSIPTVDGGPGQQCCYDAAGNLITVGGGAGTPDLVAPDPWWDILDVLDHVAEDVTPYNHCVRVGMLDCYLHHRPPNNGNGCTCNPPAHSNCVNGPPVAPCN